MVRLRLTLLTFSISSTKSHFPLHRLLLAELDKPEVPEDAIPESQIIRSGCGAPNTKMHLSTGT
jgi:hypothetical protein